MTLRTKATDGRKHLSPERQARHAARLKDKGNHPAAAAGTKRAARLRPQNILKYIQGIDVIEFARVAGISFAGRPGQELCLRLLYGLPLPDGRFKVYVRRDCTGFVLDEREVSWREYYSMLTGNETIFEPGLPKREAYLCVGARGGKTKLTSIVTAYEATRNKWRDYLSSGEKGYAGIIATNIEQARGLIQEGCLNLLLESDLKPLVAKSGEREILLTNGLGVRSFPCNVRAARGFPYFFTAYDEAGWFYLEGAKADVKIDAAVNPRRLQFPGSRHIEITTPAGKQGRFYGIHSQGGRVRGRLTVQAPTWVFRPELAAIDPEFLPREFDKDPWEFQREYAAEFDEAVDQFLPAAETAECLRLPGDAPCDPSLYYEAGLDASGLSGNDRFGFAVSGHDPVRNRHVLAVVRSWSDKESDPIMADIGALCQRYHVRRVTTDRYAKGWVHAALKKLNLEPILAPPEMEVWLNLRALIVADKVDLPLDPELKDGLLKTNCAYTNQRPRIVRARDRTGHGDKAEAAAKALWGSSQNIFGRKLLTNEERCAQDLIAHRQAEYDVLTHGRI